MVRIFKILPREAWEAAKLAQVFAGSAVDLADGYIHFSAGDQVRETAARHFAGQDDLVLVAFEAEAFGAALKWEPSRGGQLFPHLYAALDPALAVGVHHLPWRDAAHVFPPGWDR